MNLPALRTELVTAKAEFYRAALQHGVGSAEATEAFQRITQLFCQQAQDVQTQPQALFQEQKEISNG